MNPAFVRQSDQAKPDVRCDQQPFAGLGGSHTPRKCFERDHRETAVNDVRARMRFYIVRLGMALACLSSAWASDAPSRAVRLIVAFPPGGSADAIARVLAPVLQDTWAVPVVVENRAGASGSVAAQTLLREPADGHTLLFMITSHIQAVGLGMKLSYDPIEDFAPVAQVALSPQVLTVRADGPKSVFELVSAAKNRPVSFGSAGVSSTAQIYGVLFGKINGIAVTNLPYQGGAPAVTALLGGHVDAAFLDAPQALAFVRTSKLLPLAVAGVERYRSMPEVPTFKELGMNGFELRGWHGVLAKGGTPSAVVSRISNDIHSALNQPTIRRRLEQLGVEPASGSPESWASTLRLETKQWASLIEQTGVKPE